MGFSQPPVPPLPEGVDFSGRTILVTGASSGLGLEFSRQFLVHHAARLIFGVRNVDKGEAVKSSLLSDPAIQKANPNATIEVMQVDLESISSVTSFAKQVKERFQELHILMLNAGIVALKRGVTSDGHERTLQVNYLSNVILLFELLPLLETTAAQFGQPSRISFTGSRMHASNSIIKPFEAGKLGKPVLPFLDSPEGFSSMTRYGDSKLLVVLFLHELAKRYDPSKVIVNQFCPGMVETALNDDLPWYIRMPVSLVKAARARNVVQGGWVGLNAVSVDGTKSHGQIFADMEIMEPNKEATSKAGLAFQSTLWNETVDEVSKIVEVPTWCRGE